jgi:hypothetical protein
MEDVPLLSFIESWISVLRRDVILRYSEGSGPIAQRHKIRRSLISAACILLCSFGCKRSPIPLASATPSTTQSTTPRAQPDTQPTSSRITLTINGSPITFPPAELQLTHSGSAMLAQLTTHAVDPDPGNALHFDLLLDDLDDPANLAGAQWQFKADDAERAETLNGIFLDGRAVVMEPADVRILFGRDEHGNTTVDLEGQFRIYDPGDSPTPQKTVAVTGKFTASIH